MVFAVRTVRLTQDKTFESEKFDWETLNTKKVMVSLSTHSGALSAAYRPNNKNYGSKIRIKCHRPISRLGIHKPKKIDRVLSGITVQFNSWIPDSDFI